uniref:Tetraspanin n=1 Tax=Araucaria cunninghamii TaxID=56994 RepID=A0A0D6QXF1_ARACU
MGCQGCRGFVAFFLKLLNFVQAFVGVSMILYAIWMLNHWKSHVHPPLPPNAPTAAHGGYDLPVEFAVNDIAIGLLEVPLSNTQTVSGADQVPFRKFLGGDQPGLTDGLDLSGLKLPKLPAPWFIYIFLGIGIIVCVVTCIGHIAAEITNGCCLCCYSFLVIFLLLLEAALVGDIFFNHHWEKDIPDDPTGQFENIKKFIKNNVDICKWAGLAIVIIQAFSLLLAMILRAMVSTRRPDYDSDDEYSLSRNNNRQPLLNSQASQNSSASIPSDVKRLDAWSKRMREKYGLNTNDFTYDSSGPKTSASTMTSADDAQSKCAIM